MVSQRELRNATTRTVPNGSRLSLCKYECFCLSQERKQIQQANTVADILLGDMQMDNINTIDSTKS